ncbi:porin [Uliginosibacterium sp. H1]|uniref:porin n=1 Tax=Uliginosibacterium sp. H1 TaxID=3114757 RepID=UPI002E17C099|nr:porin [Uliginosibacterium sp. H1]
MQKKLIAAAIAGLVAAPAFAQSNVTIYGRIDLSVVAANGESQVDGIGLRQAEGSSSRWGLMGEEDLGNGWSAFFQLENRFYPGTGNINSNSSGTAMWKDKSWMGLASKQFGSIKIGRPDTSFDTTHGGSNTEIWGGDTIGANPSRRARAATRFDQGLRYDTPTWGFFKAYAATRLEGGDGSTSVQGATSTTAPTEQRSAYDVGTELSFGFVKFTGAYQKDYGTGYETWGIGTRIVPIAPLTILLSWADSKGFDAEGGVNPTGDSKQKAGGIGVGYKLGNAELRANYGRVWTNVVGGTAAANGDVTHIAGGVWYSLSKRTQPFLVLARDKGSYAATERTINAVQLGVRHNF